MTAQDLLNAAAPGPWFSEPMMDGPAGLTAITDGGIGVVGSTLSPEDAALIVHMRTEYPVLLARITSVSDELNRLMDSLDDHVIADEVEREAIYNAFRDLWQMLSGVDS